MTEFLTTLKSVTKNPALDGILWEILQGLSDILNGLTLPWIVSFIACLLHRLSPSWIALGQSFLCLVHIVMSDVHGAAGKLYWV